MNILHAIDSGGLYGAEKMLLDLACEQAEMGHQPVVASIGRTGLGEKAVEKEAAARGIRVEPFRMRPGPNYFGALAILRFAWREGMHLLHSHGYRGNILLGSIPRRWRQLPMLATVHGYTSLDRFTRMRLYEWLDARLLHRLDAVVLVDAAVARHPRLRGCAADRFRVINNGIRRPPAGEGGPPLDPGIVAFCRGGFTVGAIGRLSPEKGFDHLIAALALLTDQGDDVRLLILGDGLGRPALREAIARLKLQGRVLLPGYRPAARNYLPLLQAFVLSSLTEGLPITILEAMQAGVPIVATRVGAVPEVLAQGRAGLLVPSGSAPDLARGIAALRRRPELGRELAERAAERVQLYSSRRMAEEYENLYREMLAGWRLAHA